jgi:hypothetical protein
MHADLTASAGFFMLNVPLVSGLKELFRATILIAFVTARGQEWGKNAITALCTALRVFLSYLKREGLTRRDLSPSIEAHKR